MADRRPLVIVGGTAREIADGDTVPIANGGTGASSAATARANLGAVNKAGDTMSGDLSIAKASPNLALNASTGDATLSLNKASSGSNAVVNFLKASVLRWQVIGGDGAAETGSNAGSNFAINRYTDGGSGAQAVSISRASGVVTVPAGASIAGVSITGGGGAITSSNSALSGSLYFNNFINSIVQGSVGVLSYQHQPGVTAQWQIQVNASANFTFLSTGRAQAQVAWDVVSDERLKTAFEPVTGALASIDEVDVVTFERIDEPPPMQPSRPSRYFGVRAQQMKRAQPAAVSVSPTHDLPDRLVVATDAAGLLALAAVKELKEVVSSLRARIESLEAELASGTSIPGSPTA